MLFKFVLFKRRIGLRPAALLKKRRWRRCFLINFEKFLRTPLLQNTCGWLILLLYFNTENVTALQVLSTIEFSSNTLPTFKFWQLFYKSVSQIPLLVFSLLEKQKWGTRILIAPRRTRILISLVWILNLWEPLFEPMKIKTHYSTNYFKNFLEHNFQKQPSIGVLGKDVLKIYNKFTGEHPCRIVISIKLLCNFIEITPRHGCSPVHLSPSFRTPYPRITSGGLLLNFEASERKIDWEQ